MTVVRYFLPAGLIEVDDFTSEKIKYFIPYSLLYAITLFANMKALERSNVDVFVQIILFQLRNLFIFESFVLVLFVDIQTVIVFRACTPLIVSLLDW